MVGNFNFGKMLGGVTPLLSSYPHLLRISTHKEASVTDYIVSSSKVSSDWNLHFSRDLLDFEAESVGTLPYSLQSVRFSPSLPDRFSWNLNFSGSFSVKSFLEKISRPSILSPSFPVTKVWKGRPPTPRIQAFIWIVHCRMNTMGAVLHDALTLHMLYLHEEWRIWQPYSTPLPFCKVSLGPLSSSLLLELVYAL